jgi:hypothetical protein
MGKVRNPATFSSHFEVDPGLLEKLGVLDPTLALDTKLFIDPLLLTGSVHNEIRSGAAALYRDRFEAIIRLLSASRVFGDVAWRNARRLLEFHEVRGTCLGYGADTISGSGFGRQLSDQLLRVAKEITDLGIDDPDLFPVMALFEANIGPDRISDMTTNVILPSLIEFNERVLAKLKVGTRQFRFGQRTVNLPANPFQRRPTPIILVPRDILRALPIALDWDGIGTAAAHNEELRSRVNDHIGHIWAEHAKRDRGVLRKQALKSEEAFQALLDAVHEVPAEAYDLSRDPEGFMAWSKAANEISSRYPFTVRQRENVSDLERVIDVARQIVAQFRTLIEQNGLNKELFKDDGAPRHESSAQRIFFGIAYSYCVANNLDISPEVDSGSGKIDFKLSKGWQSKVLVEVKLSTNAKVVHGYEKQLEVYKAAEKTMRAVYLVIDVGKMGRKAESLIRIRNEASKQKKPLSDLEFVDARPKPPASKRE